MCGRHTSHRYPLRSTAGEHGCRLRAQLRGVDQLLGAARGGQHAQRHGEAAPPVVPHHRHQRDDPGAGPEQQRGPVTGPGEEPAQRSAQLDRVAGPGDRVEPAGDLAVRHMVQGQLDVPGIVRRGGDRVVALRHISVRRGQPQHQVLARQMPRPVRYRQPEGGRLRRLTPDLRQCGRLPHRRRLLAHGDAAGDREPPRGNVRTGGGGGPGRAARVCRQRLSHRSTAAPPRGCRARGSRCAPRTRARRGREA